MVGLPSFQFMRLTLIYFERGDELVLYLFINIYIYIHLYFKTVLFLLGEAVWLRNGREVAQVLVLKLYFA